MPSNTRTSLKTRWPVVSDRIAEDGVVDDYTYACAGNIDLG